jgi:hypothetical protein
VIYDNFQNAWDEITSHMDPSSNMDKRNVVHLIRKLFSYNLQQLPPPTFLNSLFSFFPLCLSSSSPVFPSFLIFEPSSSHPLPSMPEKSGPWQLNRVKARLRREQVEREEAASARYRVTEPQDKNSGKTG